MIILKKENKQKNKEKKKKEKPILTEEQIKKRKTRNTRIAACCFLLLLGVGVAGNWYWENSDISAKINAVSSDRDKILGEATYVDATTQIAKENAYFSSARVERQTARDESLEKLQKIVDCLAVINEDATKVNVIVDSKDLTDQIILQIKEITVSQLGCSYEDVTIIQSN